MKYIKVFLWVLLFSVMAVIYNFSAQPEYVSGDQSMFITEKIINRLPSAKGLQESEKDKKFDSLHYHVRKSAHFLLFFMLGTVLFLTLLTSFNFKSIWHLVITCLIICILYAISDEIHQLFVVGRGAQVKDVAIDFGGSFTGIALLMLILTIRKIKHNS